MQLLTRRFKQLDRHCIQRKGTAEHVRHRVLSLANDLCDLQYSTSPVAQCKRPGLLGVCDLQYSISPVTQCERPGLPSVSTTAGMCLCPQSNIVVQHQLQQLLTTQ